MGAGASAASALALQECPDSFKDSALTLFQDAKLEGKSDEEALALCKNKYQTSPKPPELTLESFQTLTSASKENYVCLLQQCCSVSSPYRFQIGVTSHFFEWLSNFVSKQGEEISRDITTEQLVWGHSNKGPTGTSPMKWSIASQCQESKESFISWCVRNGNTFNDAGDPLFAPVTIFASHAWQGKFLSFTDTLKRHDELRDEMSSFFIDIFIVNQHVPPWHESPPLLPNMVLQPPIEYCKSSLLVLSPFEDPIPLTRSWCIYEVHTTKQLGADFEIGLPSDDKKRFAKALSCGQFDFHSWVQRIDIEKAQATRSEDRDIILNLVRKGAGVVALNKLVIAELCTWLNNHGQATLKTLPVNERASSLLIESMAEMMWRQGRTKETELLMCEIVKGRREQLGTRDERTLSSMHKYGKFLRTQGQYLASEEVLVESVTILTELYGEGDPRTLNSIRELAVVRHCQTKFIDAEAQLRVVLSLRNEVCSSLEVVLKQQQCSIRNATVTSEKQGAKLQVDDSLGSNESETTEELDVQKRLNEQKIEYYEDIFCLVSTLRNLKKEAEALELINTVISGRCKLLGTDHPRTLDSFILRGKLFTSRADDSAVEEMRQVLSRMQGMLGGGIREGVKGEGEHYKAIDCLMTLAQMCAGREEYDEALKYAEDAFRHLRNAFGDCHPDTTAAKLLTEKIVKRKEETKDVCSQDGNNVVNLSQLFVWKGSTVWLENNSELVKVSVIEVNDQKAHVSGGNVTSKWVDISSLMDSRKRYCTGSAGPKTEEGVYWSFNEQAWVKIPPPPDDSGWCWWDDQELEWCAAQGCFNGDAAVMQVDGTQKLAEDVQVGDILATVNNDKASSLVGVRVLGICVQNSPPDKKIKIGNLLLSLKHRVMLDGKWLEPHFYPEAKLVSDKGSLYNFVVDNQLPIVIENVIVSTIGTFCGGCHFDVWPTQKLWGSARIVSLFCLHPLWPNILLDERDNFLTVLKNPDFAQACCEAKGNDFLMLLLKYGWNYPDERHKHISAE